MRKVLMFVFAMCLALFAVSAMAQTSTTGSIAGTVLDPQSRAVPNATVTASGANITPQSAQTNGSGQYQIVELRPGTYSVTYTLTGFSTLVREGIELTSGFTANIDVQLRVGTITETVIVTGATPLVDVQNVTKHTVATREIIDTIPAARS